MRHTTLIFLLALTLLTPSLGAQDSQPQGTQAKVLKILEPTGGADAKKRILLVNKQHLEAIVNSFDLKKINGFIELAPSDLHGVSVTKLAKVKRGKIKWLHKIEGTDYFKVKFKEKYFQSVLEKIRGDSMRPGLRVQVADSKTSISSDNHVGKHFSETTVKRKKYIVAWCEIIFTQLADLAVSLKYPVKLRPGDPLGKDTSFVVENRGTFAAEATVVELLLSKDNTITYPSQTSADASPDTADSLLENGKITVPALKPGESLTIVLEAPVYIPAQLPPNKYYLGAVIDPADSIKELDESNNTYAGFMVIHVDAPKGFGFQFPATQLVYTPSDYNLSVIWEDTVVSTGREWRKCKIKPHVHQIKHAAWPDFHWEINTLEKGVYQIKGAKFCKTGGRTDREMNLKMAIKGGSKSTPPAEIMLKLPETGLTYETETGKFTLTSHLTSIAHPSSWVTLRLKSHLYRIRNTSWQGFFWEVDTFRKKVNRITNGQFNAEGGTATPLPLEVKVEK
ncbi:MAG: hypothetical protein GY765_12035 [bacterium]|nr:hypothetical protein [bacterium]